ncbi:hypothetical protein VNO78_21481 [Psophocarpus tetragonolobus]|uniref:Uncharacterized protein n=1 Tax=Psophocarpus tetragonolobus TaxID=3891 RepID=A0AAN9SC76_PSOTE
MHPWTLLQLQLSLPSFSSIFQLSFPLATCAIAATLLVGPSLAGHDLVVGRHHVHGDGSDRHVVEPHHDGKEVMPPPTLWFFQHFRVQES